MDKSCSGHLLIFLIISLLIMQFTTYAVQTVKIVELVMVDLVSDSSKQWSLIKIQNIWVELF